MNKENYKKVLDQITQYPKTWNQHDWHCGTSHCFGGWAQLLAGKEENKKDTRRDARIYLDITYGEANVLFSVDTTLQQLTDIFTTGNIVLYKDGYNLSGYDRGGYNRDGYNRDGYNRDGYDCDGLDQHNKPRS